jgi:cell fate (sporulation/competence/biofilm development) regulator YlbF (YheA/YmcA/DUF963 family)
MKTMIIILLLVHVQASAQTAAEFLQQKKTQRQYLLTQIAALKLYARTALKGYTTVRKGLQRVGDRTGSDRAQHKTFMQLYRSGEEKSAQEIKETFRQIQTKIQQTKLHMDIKDNQAQYVHTVFSEIQKRCMENIEEIIALSTKDQLQIDPAERTRRCDMICEEMEKRKLFTDRFCQSVLSMKR